MITLQIASMPEREKMLEISLRSLLPQVDKANVMLTRYEPGNIPHFLNDSRVRVFHHDNSLEDGSRFLFADRNEEFTLIADDDIEYPENFVQYLLGKWQAYRGIVGIMGKNLKPRPIQSYYKDEIIHYKAFGDVLNDVEVEVIGCCGILYHANQVRLGAPDMICPNTDIVVSAWAKRRGVTLTVCAHAADYLRNLMPMAPNAPSIFGKYSKNDKILTDFVNENF